eukprot:COSAG01_NODE_656_length_14462_cov_20.440716_13_plen_81_part_00
MAMVTEPLPARRRRDTCLPSRTLGSRPGTRATFGSWWSPHGERGSIPCNSHTGPFGHDPVRVSKPTYLCLLELGISYPQY